MPFFGILSLMETVYITVLKLVYLLSGVQGGVLVLNSIKGCAAEIGHTISLLVLMMTP